MATAVQSARHERGSYHGKYRLHLQISDVHSYRSHDCFRVARIEPRTMARYIAFSEHEQNLAALRSRGRCCRVASAAERASRQGRAACECRGDVSSITRLVFLEKATGIRAVSSGAGRHRHSPGKKAPPVAGTGRRSRRGGLRAARARPVN